MSEFELSVGLLMLCGVLSFALGFLLGTQVFAAVLRERERQLRRERRAINEVRRYLWERHGVELPAWITQISRKEQEQEVPPKRRHWFGRKR